MEQNEQGQRAATAEEERPSAMPPKRPTNRRTVILAVALFIAAVIGMFAFAFMLQTDEEGVQNEENEQEMEDKYADITRIDGKHFYIDGVHTVVGEIPMPTPCDLLESSARVAESAPEQVTLEFEVINNAEFCAEVITPQRFKVSAEASEDATISAEFEGRPVELNLVEAEPGETPEDFELFIKG